MSYGLYSLIRIIKVVIENYLQINFYTYSFSCLLLDLSKYKQLIMNIMTVIMFVKSKTPTPIIGPDDDPCE